MSAHTPGPWKLETVRTSIGLCHKIGPLATTNDREKWACVYGDGINPEDKVSLSALRLLADARLIAAAPELLEACKVALAVLTSEWGQLGVERNVPELARAIAKAEGKAVTE